jgi:hypothetical protein
MKFYEGLKLPDVSAFRGESVESPSRSMPRPLDMRALAAMEAAVPALGVDDPGTYVAHISFSRLRLRNVEIVNARAHWIVGAVLESSIVRRRIFSPRAG